MHKLTVDSKKVEPNVNALKVLLEEKNYNNTMETLLELVPELEPFEESEKTVTKVSAFDEKTGAPIGVVRFKKKAEITEDPLVSLLYGLSKQEIRERCMYDLNFLSRFLMPDVHIYDYPPLIIAMWKMVVTGMMDLEVFIGQAKYALGIPRGFIKTTVFVKILSIYAQLFTTKNFILIIGNTEPNATNIIKDIMDLMKTEQFKNVFGDIEQTMVTERKELVRFYLNGRSCIFVAKGVLGSSRGLSIGIRRPSLIIPDDMQSEENAASPAESTSTITWWSSTILPSVAPEGSVIVYVGNTFAYEGALLNQLIKDKAWVSLTLGAILSDGTSLWEELMPIKMLLESFRSALVIGRDTQWLAQMMNAIDISHNSNFEADKIEQLYNDRFRRKYINEKGEEIIEEIDYGIDHSWVMIDPSSQRPNADEISIIRTKEDKVGNIITTHSIKDKMNPEENVLKAIGLCIETNTPVICVEDIAYQVTLIFWINKYLEKLDIDWISVMGYNPGKQHKNVRITTDFRLLAKGAHFIAPIPWDNHYKPQASLFNKMIKTNKDDVLDNVASSYAFHNLNRAAIKNVYDNMHLKHMLKIQNEQKRKSISGPRIVPV